MTPGTSSIPLCVDLDRTLVRVNTLEEAMAGALRQTPGLILLIPFWALRGQAFLWAKLTRFRPAAAALPYSDKVLDLLQSEAKSGRAVWLVTGAHERVARDVAEHLGSFRGVLASSGEKHLVGQRKADELIAQFGVGGFDYVGDSMNDLPVFRNCRKAYVVSSTPTLPDQLQAESIEHVWIREPGQNWSGLLKAMRPRQWVKNVLVFVPALLGHRMTDKAALESSAYAFALLCLASSAVYLFNDIVDMEADRLHHIKRSRPFARGDVSIRTGGLVATGLLLFSPAVGWLVNPQLSILLTLYIAGTALYSVWLKQLLIIDMILLASFYAARVFVGSAATGIPVSPWTALFCLLIFFGLAAVKRCAEIRNWSAGVSTATRRRAYTMEDAAPLMSMGMASMVGAVLTVGLYLGSSDVRELYRSPDLLWLTCPILLGWVGRVWALTHRGVLLDEDPVAFALRDTWSYGALILVAIIFLLAL